MVDENEISDEVEEFEAAEWADYDLITCAKFHGRSDNRIAYSTKHGEIFYIDMRISSKSLHNADNPKPSIVVGNEAPNNYIRRYLNSISEFAFLNDEYRVVSRDYLDTKVLTLPNQGLGSPISEVFHPEIQCVPVHKQQNPGALSGQPPRRAVQAQRQLAGHQGSDLTFRFVLPRN